FDQRGVDEDAPLLAGLEAREAAVALPSMPLREHVAEDFRMTGLSLKKHPIAFFRRALAERGVTRSMDLESCMRDDRVRIAGLVLIRQRPGTAKGVTFLTREDETGPANIIVWRDLFEKERRIVMSAAFLCVEGKLQKASGVIHVVAERLFDLTHH